MVDYSVSDNSIKNPLNMELKEDRYCPICGNDTYGPKIAGGSHRLQLSLWTGNPCTRVPERKDLSVFMCYKCRTKLYKTIENKLLEMKRRANDEK